MPHIIVIGTSGQLARALKDRDQNHGVSVSAFGRKDCDLSADESDIRKFAAALPACEGIIIAAAYTAVDAAEDDKDTARQVNAVAPGIFAEECAARGIPLVHISTDYVFPGDGDSPLKPDAPTDPINAYGATKLGGEHAILNTPARAAILRTSWVFDGTGKNFLTTMLRLSESRDTLGVVDDQKGRPTYAGALADASLAAINKMIDTPDMQGGVYHVSGTGDIISWADFAIEIFNQAGKDMTVNRIPASDYPTPAKRPSYSALDVSTFEQDFGHALPDWKYGIKEALAEQAKSPLKPPQPSCLDHSRTNKGALAGLPQSF